MTSPLEKPFEALDNPPDGALDNPPHGAQAGSENSIETREPSQDPPQSPYAPKLKRRIRATPRAQDSNVIDAQIPRFLLGGERPGESAEEPRLFTKSEDRLLWIGERSEPAPAERPDGPESSEKLPKSEDRAHAPPTGNEAGAATGAGEIAPPAQLSTRATENSEGNTAADIERLEASLRWLKHQSGELRGADTDALLAAGPTRLLASIGELDKLDIGAARSLEPENLVPPALMRAQRGNMESALSSRRVPLLILIAGLVAAPIAYFTAERSSSSPEAAREARVVAVEPQIAAPPRMTKPESEPQDRTVQPQPIALPPGAGPQSEVNAGEHGDAEPATNTDSKPDPASLPPAAVSPPPAAASPPPAAASPPPAAASPAQAAVSRSGAAASASAGLPSASIPASRSKDSQAPGAAPVRALSRADIELLMKQGEQFMAVGDVAAARIVFRRAAEAGDAAAALAMGTTYDPLILKRMGALGVTPDPYQARSWYERAKDFGSTEAPRRIEMLANR